MFQIQPKPFLLKGQESCGLSFASQLLEIEMPADSPEFLWLRDEVSGRLYPLQKSRQNPARGFLKIAIAPFEKFHLKIAPKNETGEINALQINSHSLANENIALRFAPDCDGPLDALNVSGPISSIALRGRTARGKTFFDARSRVLKTRGKWLEKGPLRAAWNCRVEFEDGGFYAVTITLDAGEKFAAIDEELGAESGAQLVWDFCGNDLPRELFLLDASAGGTRRKLHFHFDARMVRLAAWTQYQQLHDFSDGFALLFENDFLGVVTLEGGSWRGNRLNHVEAWTRRFWRDDKGTRREPWDAKADAMPGPEPISARGTPQATPHFCLESWIGADGGQSGRRRFALVAAAREELFPGAHDKRRGDDLPSGRFENSPDRERYHRAQSLLRQIHVQRGMLPLQELAFNSFEWPEETPPQEGVWGYPHALLAHQLRHHEDDETRRIAQMKEYLDARVYGFWEGGGAAFSNCVVGRAIAPEMFHFEFLARGGKLDEKERQLLRAQFAFLCHLFNSENYYPGAATMRPNGDCQSFEPTIAGMANQNFLTDVICVAAVGAQVFSDHPDAEIWRERFASLWRRQLEFHRYPKSGVWEESHTYFLHVLHTVLPVLLRRRDDGNEVIGEGFESPQFQSLCASIFAQLSPRHAHHDGFRHLLAWGDHAAARDYQLVIFGELARAFLPHNLELACRLAG